MDGLAGNCDDARLKGEGDVGYDTDEDAQMECEEKDKYPAVAEVLCSPLPIGVDLHSFLEEPSNLNKKGPHAAYAREYYRCAPTQSSVTSRARMSSRLLPADARLLTGSSEWAQAMAVTQEQFFKSVDAYQIDDIPKHSVDPQAPKRQGAREV
jgi:hypothetical protein